MGMTLARFAFVLLCAACSGTTPTSHYCQLSALTPDERAHLTQLSITLSTTNGEIVAFAFNRGRSGFSERDRMLLDALGRHLLVGRENAKRLSQAHADAARRC